MNVSKSINKSVSSPRPNGSQTFEEYWTELDVETGLRNGSLFEGVLRINQKNYKEAYISAPDGSEDFLIEGLLNRNRALNGDVVVCILLPTQTASSKETTTGTHSPAKLKLVNSQEATPVKKLKENRQKSMDVGASLPESQATPQLAKSLKKPKTKPKKKAKALTEAAGLDENKEDTGVERNPKDNNEHPISNTENIITVDTIVEDKKKRRRRSKKKKNGVIETLTEHLEASCAIKDSLTTTLVQSKQGGISNESNFTVNVIIEDNEDKKKRSRRSKKKKNGVIEKLTEHLEASCAIKESLTTTLVQSKQGGISNESNFTVNVIIDNVIKSEQLVDQASARKVAKVVFIKEFKHSRCAIGSLRPWPYGQSNHQPNWILFAPKDHRIPRLKIPFKPELASFLSQPSMLYLARIESWEDINNPVGSLSYIIGNSGDIEAETIALLLQHEVDYSPFSQEILDDLPHLPWSIPAEEIKDRRDFRDQCIFTIDPADARDLDDAVSGRFLKMADDGVTRLYQVSVHIADVSFFVKEDTLLDGMASQRATSTYLVDRVIPMLPSVLCEHICSLNPGEDRLAFSVEWTVNDSGEILEEWFGRSIIRSCVKLSYDHAQAVIEGRDEINLPEIKEPHSKGDICKTILVLQELAGHLRKKRVDQGALRIDIPRLAFSMDWETRTPTGFRVYELKESNRLIEEFMLLANMRVAEKIYEVYPDLAVLRSHPPPPVKKLIQLSETMQTIGIHLDVSSSKAIQESLIRYGQGSSDPMSVGRNLVISNLLAKPMKCASYICSGIVKKEEHFRHYALSVPFYTHFTSPIRRYPDILVHRLLSAALKQEALDHWNQNTVHRLLDNCNSRKLSAKALQESHSELHLAELIRKIGSVDIKGIVLSVLDHSVDVVLIYLGIIRRLYLDKLPLDQLSHEKHFDIGKLTLVWRPESDGSAPVRQVISVFSLLEIQLVPCTETDKLDFSLVLQRPTYLP